MRREILGLRRHKLQLLLLVEVVVVVVSVAVASTNSLVWAPKEAQIWAAQIAIRVTMKTVLVNERLLYGTGILIAVMLQRCGVCAHFASAGCGQSCVSAMRFSASGKQQHGLLWRSRMPWCGTWHVQQSSALTQLPGSS